MLRRMSTDRARQAQALLKETTMPTATLTPETRVLSLKTVLARVPLSRTTLWRMEREGLFPQRIKLSENRVGWLEGEIEAWIAAKKNA